MILENYCVPPVGFDDNMVMFAGYRCHFLVNKHPAGHAQMRHPDVIIIKGGEDKFGAPV